ncbi:retropepsin-like aspartic protease family protein [Ghiorsea bivora]|uniref:retropepsin-like aspartic protease family protein n=1 Tax=Ghiorsea bivora TaxID=1485545 RepID=UPI00056F1242|nr:retropepsin-like aspartic protease [Ghiorsea bivora]
MLKVLIYLILFSFPWLSHAEMYKIIDHDGNITYTDLAPSMEAKQYKPKGINAVDNPNYNMNKLSMVIPYIDKDGAMVVQGSVNGIAMSFIVDTGATLLAIPPIIAKRAGLYDSTSTMVTTQTANGEVKVPKVKIKLLSVAKIKLPHVEATIQSISTKNNELGLLGMSFFKHYKMTIDHNKKEIQLEPK